MATRVLVQHICDVCMDYHEGAQITTITVTIDGKTYELDLCTEHKEELQGSWLYSARKAQKGAESPRKPAKASAQRDAGFTPSGVPRTLPCTAKGCDRMFGDERARSKHHSTIHGIKRK